MARHGSDARRPGLLGMLLVLVGGASVLVSFVLVDWYDTSGLDSIGGVGFARLADNADRPGLPSIVPAYFDWLAWLLLIVVIAVGMVANVPNRVTGALRSVGLVIGVAGSASTYWALEQYTSSGPAGTSAFHQADVGIWLALGGYLLAGLGAVVGPRRI